MRFTTLDQWLAWQETLNPRDIDLGLERVAAVWERLAQPTLPFAVVSVAGTNGKGSCVAMLEAILLAAGYRVGAYTSPHLLRYNERIRIGGAEADDRALMKAFEQVERARGDTPLTYFEFGTLAALVLFQDAALDAVVLEVGLGGRLDAVNVVDADVALVSSIGVDHVEWLGPDRESIGREKAGIFRPGRPAVCGDPRPPQALLDHAHGLGAPLYRFGSEFGYRPAPTGWSWFGPRRRRNALPAPALRGAVQLQNAAAVLMTLELLRGRLPVEQGAIRRGLLEAHLPGRFQVVPGDVDLVLDVSHNVDGVQVLADNLRAMPAGGRTYAVLGMLQDKDATGVARVLDAAVAHWYAAGLAGTPRGLPASELAQRLAAAGVRAPVTVCESIAAACGEARAAARTGDRIVIFGSFYTVAEALRECV
ncbi:MAG: bifunctional tetrahydrofolate synthase/dihydrofolate synthase [Gammaproteobacteria bacterium]